MRYKNVREASAVSYYNSDNPILSFLLRDSSYVGEFLGGLTGLGRFFK